MRINMKSTITALLFLFLFSAAASAAGLESYVAKRHEEADRVAEWAENAKKDGEPVKAAELEKKSAELKALLSVMDAEMAKGEQAADPAAFNSASEHFQQIFREADVTAGLDESAAAAMKMRQDEELLSSDIGGAYQAEPLSYDALGQAGDYSEMSGSDY